MLTFLGLNFCWTGQKKIIEKLTAQVRMKMGKGHPKEFLCSEIPHARDSHHFYLWHPAGY